MLKICSIVLNFLNQLISGDYVHLALIILLFSFLAVFIVEVLLVTAARIRRDSSYFLCFGLIVLILSFIFSFKDLLGNKRLFANVNVLAVYLSIFAALILVLFMLLKGLTAKFCIKKAAVPPVVEVKKIVSEPPYEYFEADKKLQSDYLDVNYVKNLIYKLKEKQLTDEDACEVEEFEVYLLNFAYRQPHQTEKDKLSIYLSSLIKKLAKYAV